MGQLMRVGVFGSERWEQAARASGLDVVRLAGPPTPTVRPQEGDIALRLRCGEANQATLARSRVDFLLDEDGAGLQFVRAGAPGATRGADAPTTPLALLHEVVGVPLVSWMQRPLLTALRGVPSEVVASGLRSPTWVLAASDRAAALELRRFGAANVALLPAAVGDDAITNAAPPLSVDGLFEREIGFIGDVPSDVFLPGRIVDGADQRVGLLATICRGGLPAATFAEVFFDLYRLAPAPTERDSDAVRAAMLEHYFNAKRFFFELNALGQRERHIAVLQRRLGGKLSVCGDGWDAAWGIRTEPAIVDPAARRARYRTTRINLGLPSGFSETGVSPDAFEITAAGGLLLHVWRPELEDYFEIGREIEVFRDELELVEKCEQLLADPQRCHDIAVAGQTRTQRDHLLTRRLDAICRLVRDAGNRPAEVVSQRDGVVQEVSAQRLASITSAQVTPRS